MSREQFQNFLNKKMKIEQKREETLTLEVGELELTFIRNSALERKATSLFRHMLKETKLSDVNDIIDGLAIGALFTDEMMIDVIELIYDSCITLQNKELHQELEVKIPTKIIETLFDLNEIYELATNVLVFLLDSSGKTDIKKKKKK